MSRFDYFVVFAEMRTGSNFLEANINAFDGLLCHGEAFNPHFIGYPNKDNILGVSQKMREADPAILIAKIKEEPGVMGGFRFFNDHDPRALELCLPDPRCAKIILTRNPVESFVSWKIAAATGQWKLTNVEKIKTQQAHFDSEEFEAHLEALQAFQVTLLNGLQKTGQTAFYVAYEDLQDVDVMNGLAKFLGIDAQISGLDKKLKKQNPEPMSEKVTNFAAMEKSLARLDRFNLNRTPNFEPRRGPAIPSYFAAPVSGLLYMPMKSGPDEAIAEWLAGLDGKTTDELQSDFSQNSLRKWKRTHPGHRSFTVLRHPLARAHTAFCERILTRGKGTYPEIRKTLRRVHNLPVPEEGVDLADDYDMGHHRSAFLVFLQFLKGNLAAQTAIRVDPTWSTQSAILQGFAQFGVPDMLAREDNLTQDLAILAGQLGKTAMPPVAVQTDPYSDLLAAIYDSEIEAAARDAYQRDYIGFGFADWKLT